MTAPSEPCGNEDCDTCHPQPRWRVSQHRVQHLTNVREFKAASREEAIEIFERGTAWPSSYDDRHGRVIQLDDLVVTQIAPPKSVGLTRCWNSPEWKAEMDAFCRPADTEIRDEFDVGADGTGAEEHF